MPPLDGGGEFGVAGAAGGEVAGFRQVSGGEELQEAGVGPDVDEFVPEVGLLRVQVLWPEGFGMEAGEGGLEQRVAARQGRGVKGRTRIIGCGPGLDTAAKQSPEEVLDFFIVQLGVEESGHGREANVAARSQGRGRQVVLLPGEHTASENGGEVGGEVASCPDRKSVV